VAGKNHKLRASSSSSATDSAAEGAAATNAGADGDASFDDYAMKGRQYTWSGNETLPQLLDRRDEILARNAEAQERHKNRQPNRPIWDVIKDSLDDEDDTLQCTVCAL